MRTAEGKERAIYLDHAGNVRRHGFAEDIVPESLDDGSKKFNEKRQTKEKKEPKVKTCPQCYQEMVGIRCKCGYEIPLKEKLEYDQQELQKLKAKDNKTFTIEDKARWYGELVSYCYKHNHKIGYASHLYKEKFGVWPNAVKNTPHNIPEVISSDVDGFIKHTMIKRAKRNDRSILRKAG